MCLSFLTGTADNGPQSIDESLYELENTSILFREAWQRVPTHFNRAARVRAKAMEQLDHIVNEILRAMGTKKPKVLTQDRNWNPN